MSRGSANSSEGSGRGSGRESTPARPADSDRGDESTTKPDSAAQPDLGGQLLDCVLRETLSAVNDEATRERIVDFARRNADREVSDPEVAEELIRVIVRTRFGKLALPPELPRWIAETLLDDPDSLDRLQSLWSRAGRVES